MRLAIFALLIIFPLPSHAESGAEAAGIATASAMHDAVTGESED